MATKHQLAQLIDSVKAANRWSDIQLAAIAEKKGYAVSKSNIARLRKPMVSIKGETILMLADILGVSPSQVAIAAVESMGIALPAYSTITPEAAVRLDVDLSERDKRSILAMLTELRDSSTAPGAPSQASSPEKIKGSVHDPEMRRRRQPPQVPGVDPPAEGHGA